MTSAPAVSPAPGVSRGSVAGLFAGIGGLELGLSAVGYEAELLCEFWDPAAATLRRRFSGVDVVGDIRGIDELPKVDVVTAGFPCTDLSQVGLTHGINGAASGLIREVFRLVEQTPPRWLVLENVPNMLTLHRGSAIAHITTWLDDHCWDWAYRTVDSQYFGVSQRRRRVIVVASQTDDPRTVLFADEAPVAPRHEFSSHGFYWTEGNRGVGWGDDVVPTLKGGSGLGLASPPAVWRKSSAIGPTIVTPSIEVGEMLQGFVPGWTAGIERIGLRWKMVGNAVTVPVAEWVGRRLADPGAVLSDLSTPFVVGRRWPGAASSVGGQRQTWLVSESPLGFEHESVGTLLDQHGSAALSHKATSGFLRRLERSSLRAGGEPFHRALREHVLAMA